MIVNRTAEFTSYNAPAYTGTGRRPVFLRNISEPDRGFDTVEISENARKKHLDSGGSVLEKAILKALPSLEIVRELLRENERDADDQRRKRIDNLKSLLSGGRYGMDDLILFHVAGEVMSHIEGK